MKYLFIATAFLLNLTTNAQQASLPPTDSLLSTRSLNTSAPLGPVPDPAEGSVYRLKPAIDIPVTLAGTAATLYGFSKIYNKDASSAQQILALRDEDIARINRFGTELYSEKASDASDLLFYGSMPLPLILLADGKVRKDAGKIGILYLEAMAVTGVLYTGAAYVKDKYRPMAYNSEVPLEKRTSGGAKNSFFGGHPALVGTATFFTAKVLHDYHPEWRNKWILFAVAGAATTTTGYLRIKGGNHFLTDVIIGTAVGTLSGILIPQIHKNMPGGNALSLQPRLFGPQKGVAMAYRF